MSIKLRLKKNQYDHMIHIYECNFCNGSKYSVYKQQDC